MISVISVRLKVDVFVNVCLFDVSHVCLYVNLLCIPQAYTYRIGLSFSSEITCAAVPVIWVKGNIHQSYNMLTCIVCTVGTVYLSLYAITVIYREYTILSIVLSL